MGKRKWEKKVFVRLRKCDANVLEELLEHGVKLDIPERAGSTGWGEEITVNLCEFLGFLKGLYIDDLKSRLRGNEKPGADKEVSESKS